MRYIYESKSSKVVKEKANFYFTEMSDNVYEVTKNRFGTVGNKTNTVNVMDAMKYKEKVVIERLDGLILSNHLF
ncbi:hypothetical protein J41TS2_24780 [Bacillus sonorensis]|uniref:hypothetical protein n=1 Tax=Bacillus sonorensis TaxID=119858 RepID=UPI001B21CA31|nr:hypothetical protein [Bacillus sonorensis]GIN67057.1 hypothetical protein J41TS2_24780 [Bacillus sonorensis]